MSLGSKVKSLRKQMRITQKELSDRSGITQATISRVEANLMLQIKSDALRRLAGELKTTTDFLSGKEDVITPEALLRSDPAVKDFLELFSKLDMSTRENVKSYMRYLADSTLNENAQQ